MGWFGRTGIAVAGVVATSTLGFGVSARATSGSPADTSADAYVSPYTAAQIASGGTDEGNPYTMLARHAWLAQVYGANPAPDFGKRLFEQLHTQQSKYPGQVAGANPPAGIPAWQSLGPAGDIRTFNYYRLKVVDSGRLSTILPDPTDPNTMYVLSAMGGLWKTTDFTDPHPTWVPKTDGTATTSSGAIAFGRNSNTLYLGLGDPFDGTPLAGGAMLRSTDGGDSWTRAPFVSLPGAGAVGDVKVDTSQAQDIVLVGTDHGLFRSTDGGVTYSQAAGIPTDSFVWSLARTSAGWLAAAQAGSGNPPGFPGISVFPGTTGDGTMYLSTDHGASWQPIANPGDGYSGAGRTTLGVGAPGDSVVYAFAGTPDGSAQVDLFRSTDGGQSWTPLNLPSQTPTNPNADQPDMNLMGFQAFYNQMVLVDPTDASRNTVYLGGELSSAKTTDGGHTWTLLTNWLAQFGLPYAHADFHCAAFSTLGGKQTIVFGEDGGLAISTDGGASFSSNQNEGLVDTQHYSLTADPTNPDTTLTGLQDLGTRLRQGSTATYNQVFGGDGFGTGWSQSNGAVAVGSTYFGTILSSTGGNPNRENKWRESSNGIDQNDANFYTEVASPSAAADPTGNDFFTTTFHHVYATTDGANSWHSILDLSDAPVGIRAVLNPIGISPLDTNHIAVAGTGGRILITTDGGHSWTTSSLNDQVPGWVSFNSSVAWANNRVLYATNENTSPATRAAKSTDGGVHWSAAGSGLPDVPIHELLVSPTDRSGNTVYAATFLGVYQTTDGGQSWHLFGSGLPPVNVFGLYMPPDGRFLRIATYGRGIWEIRP